VLRAVLLTSLAGLPCWALTAANFSGSAEQATGPQGWELLLERLPARRPIAVSSARRPNGSGLRPATAGAGPAASRRGPAAKRSHCCCSCSLRICWMRLKELLDHRSATAAGSAVHWFEKGASMGPLASAAKRTARMASRQLSRSSDGIGCAGDWDGGIAAGGLIGRGRRDAPTAATHWQGRPPGRLAPALARCHVTGRGGRIGFECGGWGRTSTTKAPGRQQQSLIHSSVLSHWPQTSHRSPAASPAKLPLVARCHALRLRRLRFVFWPCGPRKQVGSIAFWGFDHSQQAGAPECGAPIDGSARRRAHQSQLTRDRWVCVCRAVMSLSCAALTGSSAILSASSWPHGLEATAVLGRPCADQAGMRCWWGGFWPTAWRSDAPAQARLPWQPPARGSGTAGRGHWDVERRPTGPPIEISSSAALCAS